MGDGVEVGSQRVWMTALGVEIAVADPLGPAATTTTRIVCPTSVLVSV